MLAALFAGRSLLLSPAASRPAVAVRAQLGGADPDTVINELLGAPENAVLSVMGQRLNTLTDRNFMVHLEQRRARAASTAEQQALGELSDAVCDFLEELVSRVQEVGPQIREQEESAAAAAQRAEAEAEAAPVAASVGTASAGDPFGAINAEMGQLPELPARQAGESLDEAQTREKRALNRFKLEKLLDAAHTGAGNLDAALRRMGSELDEPFFEHLRWEVEQQVAAKNEKLLGILELVVQRACVEAEAGHPEVELLAALLQTSNRELRQEMYQRRLTAATPEVQRQFASVVRETQLTLEKEVLEGRPVDTTLLQQLRVIALEMFDHMQQP